MCSADKPTEGRGRPCVALRDVDRVIDKRILPDDFLSFFSPDDIGP
jgi:hypothetical protein